MNRTFQAKENYFLQTMTQVLNWMQMSVSMKLLMRIQLVLLQLLNPPQLDSALHQLCCINQLCVQAVLQWTMKMNVIMTTENDTNTSLFGWRNCFEWGSKPLSCATQTFRHNIIKVRLAKLEGPARSLGDSPSAEQVWQLLFSNSVTEEIVQNTNCKLASMRTKIENHDSSYQDTDCEEISSLIGLLSCSIFKSSRESLQSSFSTSITGRPIFRAIMAESWCFILIRALHLMILQLEKSGRKLTQQLQQYHTFSTCSSKICQKYYAMDAHICVDETLVPFRGSVHFIVYMPMEPAKYGIKLLCLTDVNNSYLYNAYIYRGKGSDGAPPYSSRVKTPSSSSAQAVVRLTKCFYKTNRNITCDNLFCSLEITQELLKHGLTLVATMKANKPQIPPEFLPNKTRAVGLSLHGFTKELTLLSNVLKKSKVSFHFLLCTILNSMTLQLANQKSFRYTMRQNLRLTLLIRSAPTIP
ncbi:hypothetical protein PR048_032993 [Dryococelus australis]|uniref:PiggyBac transposable element-derived protein domain-containing protein n=1 Tax=Dryococelus australis TaxID=614101 RepID=A0ABQ9G3T8_9NEOP|nr:hypothetical protein PR048_032993 [Dryococelus australis]